MQYIYVTSIHIYSSSSYRHNAQCQLFYTSSWKMQSFHHRDLCAYITIHALIISHIFGPNSCTFSHLLIFFHFHLWYKKSLELTPLSSKKSSNTFEIYMFNRSQTTRINQFEFLSTREGCDGSNLKYQILSLDITY